MHARGKITIGEIVSTKSLAFAGARRWSDVNSLYTSRLEVRVLICFIHSRESALKCVDRLLHAHMLDLLDREMEYLSSIIENDSSKREKMMAFFGEAQDFPTLMNTARTLREAER